MKFSLFFLLFASLIGYKIDGESYSGIIGVWMILNLLLMSIAYVTNQPNLILNKKSNGSMSYILLIINFPMLLLTWILFFVYDKVINENFAHQIANTNIWISRRPSYFKIIKDFNIVIDLTAEFFRDRTDKIYIAIPNLDGMPLRNYNCDVDIKNQKILVHCANGHGRSSLFVAILLIENKICTNVEEALELIVKSRKDAVPNREQRVWLEKLYTS